MSDRLDDLARTFAQPMPRRRALRLLGGAIVGAVVPGVARTAGATPSRRVRVSDTHTCTTLVNTKGWHYCTPETQYCWPTCCAPDETCQIVPNGKCPTATCVSNCKGTVCGKHCCLEGEYCADARRSLCCKNEEAECRVLAPAGLPSTGKEPATCCPQSRPRCCANDKRMECCEAEGSCCAGKCCPPDKECKKGECGCPKGKKTCGRRCCDKDEVCAKREGLDRCCRKGSVFNAPGKRRFCCPPGTVPAAKGCCPPGRPDCCVGDAQNLPPLPQPGKVCVGGELVAI